MLCSRLCFNELEPSALSLGRSVSIRDESSPIEATLEVYVPSLKRGHIALSWLWLSLVFSN